MVSHRLIFKLYLWLLLALTVSVAGAAAAFTVLSPESYEDRVRAFVQRDLGSLRDLTERLLTLGLPLETVREVLSPLGAPHDGRLAVLAPDGRPLLEAGMAGPEPLRLSAEDRARVLADDLVMRWEGHGRAVVAMPMLLPGGRPAIFAVTFRRFRWEGTAVPWRLLGGLAALLATLWLLSWPLAAHLARPLQRMAAAADALGQGDLSVRIGPGDVQHRHRRRMRRDEIGRLAESFNRMAENLQRLVLGHKQLLADISHELRSPLARLKLALALAREEQGAGQVRYLDLLERQGDAMEALIAELLFYARLDEAPYALRSVPVRLEDLVEGALLPLRPDATARGVTLRAHVPADLAPVEADPSLLERALANALRNAIAFSPEGGAVDVTVRREPGRIVLAVRDEGPGVPEEQLERIFEPFVRTDTARARGSGGVGLGLAIVRRCMQAHGGGATAARGAEGRGLVLTLWLPTPPAR